jgi:peroxiredoxin
LSALHRAIELLAPAAKDFEAQGISIVAVGTDSVEGLGKTAEKAKQDDGFPFPLVSDESLKAFKAYRAYDDFERMPCTVPSSWTATAMCAGRTSATSPSPT